MKKKLTLKMIQKALKLMKEKSLKVGDVLIYKDGKRIQLI